MSVKNLLGTVSHYFCTPLVGLCSLKRSELDKRCTKVAPAGTLLHTADVRHLMFVVVVVVSVVALPQQHSHLLEDIVDQFKDSSSPEVLRFERL